MLIDHGGIGAKSRNGFGSLYVPNLKSFKINNETDVKNFSSLNNKCILFNQFSNFDTWVNALSEIGLVYRKARISIKRQERLLIAKPIVQLGNNDRHSKPYFLHVNKLPNGKYQGQILFMPYNYYDTSKRKEYFNVCEMMNKKISELSGGPK